MTVFLQSAIGAGAAIAIGNFDGVHCGHAAMLRRLRALADELNAPAVAITFDPHPVALLRPESAPPLLTDLSERVRLLQSSGVDEVAVLTVSHELLQMSPGEFFDRVIVGEATAAGLLEGPNFRFGRDRAGDVDYLLARAAEASIRFEVMPSVDHGGRMISSSRIRELIGNCSLQEAVDLLGHPYRIRGTVCAGARRGRTIGFPTANLEAVSNLLPGHAVYGGVADVAGERFPAAVSIGPNPTFGEQSTKVECHLAGFSGDLYGTQLAVDLLQEIRPLQRFADVAELVAQIQADVARAEQLCEDLIDL